MNTPSHDQRDADWCVMEAYKAAEKVALTLEEVQWKSNGPIDHSCATPSAVRQALREEFVSWLVFQTNTSTPDFASVALNTVVDRLVMQLRRAPPCMPWVIRI